jgi:hypothetical protein
MVREKHYVVSLRPVNCAGATQIVISCSFYLLLLLSAELKATFNAHANRTPA